MAQSIPAIPFKWPLLVSLTLAWCWSQITWSSGANALAKSHKDENYIQQLVGPAVDLHFHIQDVYDAGVIITAISALFAFGFTIFLSGFLIPSTRHIAIKYLRFHAHLLFFFDSLLFATLLPYTSYVARRSVQIATDVNPTLHYTTKLVTILPWFTFLFTLIAATIMYIASTQTVEPAPVASAQETKKTM